MKNIKLVVTSLEDYFYKEKLENDKDTISYNAGYDVSYACYKYDTGCIKFNKRKLKMVIKWRQSIFCIYT